MTSANEKIRDANIRHYVNLTRYDASVRQKVLSRLRGLEKELVGLIAKSGYDNDGLEKLQTKRYKQFLAEVKTSISSTYTDIRNLNAVEMRNLAEVEGQFAVNSINRVLGVKDAVPMLSKSQLNAVVSGTLIQGTPLTELWSRQERFITERFSDTVRQGLLLGRTNDEIIRSVRGTKAMAFKDGIFETTRQRASTLVRTEIQGVANNARTAAYKENDDIVEGVVFSVTFDNRTSDICMARSGLEWTLDGEPIGHDVAFEAPPLHPNCRSALIPIVKSFKDLGIKKEEIPTGTRATIDGQIPADMKFDDWLKTKSDKFQNELLGKGKAELFRSGKIGTRDLINNDGNPMTLERLKRTI